MAMQTVGTGCKMKRLLQMSTTSRALNGKIAETCKRPAPPPTFFFLGGEGEGRRVASLPYFILKKCKFIPFVLYTMQYLLNTFSLQQSYNIAVFPIFGNLGIHIL